jgi:hypothetical protein
MQERGQKFKRSGNRKNFARSDFYFIAFSATKESCWAAVRRREK